ncbi:STAS domain-containing protein [Actinoplanes sp. CA-030573]|uniref:STAS domain-containing protein n=1 Tax=Actinoplanes sp. CA-030573 TaxID=3239898 RepID=UPI003D8DF0B9
MDDKSGIGGDWVAAFAQPPGSIRIAGTDLPETARLRARGEFDHDNCDLVPAVVTEAIVTGHTRIILDLAEVTFIDAATVKALMAAGDLAASAGATVRLENAAGMVARVLAITGVPHAVTFAGRPL